MAEAYLINGTDIRQYLDAVQLLDGTIGAPPMLQGDIRVPGRPGAVPTFAWPGPRPVILGGTIYGHPDGAKTDERLRADYHERLMAFASLCYNDGRPFTLTRRLPLLTGGPLEHACTARYDGGLDQVSQLAAHAGRVAVQLLNLDAFWFESADVDTGPLTGATFSFSRGGNVTTHRVRVTLSGSASTQRLTNLTTGDWVQFAASTATHPVVLDVAAFTAVQNAGNAIQYVTSGDANVSPYWMTLAPGVNTFTLTGGGTARLTYRAAWL